MQETKRCALACHRSGRAATKAITDEPNPASPIGGLPLAARLAVTTAVTVSLMTWVVMPRMARLLGRWLYPDPRRRR